MLTKIFVSIHQQLIRKEHHLFSINHLLLTLLLRFGCHDKHENPVNEFAVPITDCVQSFIALVSQISSIWQIVSFFIMK